MINYIICNSHVNVSKCNQTITYGLILGGRRDFIYSDQHLLYLIFESNFLLAIFAQTKCFGWQRIMGITMGVLVQEYHF